MLNKRLMVVVVLKVKQIRIKKFFLQFSGSMLLRRISRDGAGVDLRRVRREVRRAGKEEDRREPLRLGQRARTPGDI